MRWGRSPPRLALVLIGLTLGACAARVVPEPIEPHLSYSAESPYPSGLRLGVGRITDERSAESRISRRPRLRVRLFGIERRGELWPGDRLFSGDVAEGVRADAVSTLSRAGIFASVRPLAVGDPRAIDWSRRSAPDLLLTGRIERFGARQYRSFELNLLRVGWLRSRLGDPTGFIRIHYRLHGPQGLVKTYTIEAQHWSESYSLPRAALDAMAMAAESLARRLYADLVADRRPPERVLAVRLLDGCGLGVERRETLMNDVGEVFRREAQVRLQVVAEVWPAPEESERVDAVLERVRDAHVDAGGIVLALVPRPNGTLRPLLEQPFGLASVLGQHAVVGCGPAGDTPAVTVIHEIAHLFGAVHVRERSSVMYPALEFDGRFFDPLNRRILEATRERPFGSPLPPDLVRRLRALYTGALKASRCCEPSALEQALMALGSARPPARRASERTR